MIISVEQRLLSDARKELVVRKKKKREYDQTGVATTYFGLITHRYRLANEEKSHYYMHVESVRRVSVD
jgi:hypothetical protein